MECEDSQVIVNISSIGDFDHLVLSPSWDCFCGRLGAKIQHVRLGILSLIDCRTLEYQNIESVFGFGEWQCFAFFPN